MLHGVFCLSKWRSIEFFYVFGCVQSFTETTTETTLTFYICMYMKREREIVHNESLARMVHEIRMRIKTRIVSQR